MSSEPVRLERRASQRFEVNLPLAIQFAGQSFSGFTQDLSGRGVFFGTASAKPGLAQFPLPLVRSPAFDYEGHLATT